MKRILIIQTAFIGDVILATPLISNLKAEFKDAKIDFLVKKGNESLLENHPDVNKVLVFDKKDKLKSLRSLISSIRKEKYDLLVNLHRFASSGIIAWLSGAKIKYGFKKNPFSFSYTKAFEHEIGNGEHEVDRNLKLISNITKNHVRKPQLFPSENDFSFVTKWQEKAYYCMAPASVWFTKQAPQEVWIALIQKLSISNADIYLIGGPNDSDLCTEILQKSNCQNAFNLAGKLSFMQSAALMKNAQRNYVNDSGPLHFASAMNAPVSAFFCSTSPTFGFGPLSDDSEIIEVQNLDCKPCGLHGHSACPKGNFRCGNELELKFIKH
jgi:heptosyltransferase-2